MNKKQIFWDKHKAAKNALTTSDRLYAQIDLICFCQDNLSHLEDYELLDMFGDYAGYVERCINAKFIRNQSGDIIRVKLGPGLK